MQIVAILVFIALCVFLFATRDTPKKRMEQQRAYEQYQKVVAERERVAAEQRRIYLQKLATLAYCHYDDMDGAMFEEFCAELLRRNGFTNVSVTKRSGDFGVDILAEKLGYTYAIQCKRSAKNIGNKAVQEAYSGKGYYKRQIAAVMTNQGFTKQANETAAMLTVRLWGRGVIDEMVLSAKSNNYNAPSKQTTNTYVAPQYHGTQKIKRASAEQEKAAAFQKRVDDLQERVDDLAERVDDERRRIYQENLMPQRNAPIVPDPKPSGTLKHTQFSTQRTPTLSTTDIERLGGILRQIYDSVSLVNKTSKPDVFFGRLHFTLDALLYLQQYENTGVFSSSPSNDYNRILLNLELTVSDFIERAYAKNETAIAGMKNEKAKNNRYFKFANEMISAFDFPDTFWTGNDLFPHYNGNLYTENNYKRVKEIVDYTYSDEFMDIEIAEGLTHE